MGKVRIAVRGCASVTTISLGSPRGNEYGTVASINRYSASSLLQHLWYSHAFSEGTPRPVL